MEGSPLFSQLLGCLPTSHHVQGC